MKAEQLMTRDVLTCSPSDSLEQAARIMWECDVGCLVVTDANRRPVGVITDRDLAMAAYTQGVALRDGSVQNAMAREVITCSASAPVSEVEHKMQVSQVRRVPITDANGKLVGIIALGDIARSAQSSPLHLSEIPGLAKTLAGITERRSRAVAAE
jgi:CBS domain-containing protein